MGIFNEYTKPWIQAESEVKKKKRAASVLSVLKKTYPEAKTALIYQTPMQLLAAVMMSAQATDKTVNAVTQGGLFKKYKTPKDFANANPAEFEKEISRIGLYRAKARNVIATAKLIEKNFKGKLPKTIAELTTFPGVGRKTASIVLWNVYGIIEGIAVDTHVFRLSQRLGFTETDDVKKIEQGLMNLTPDKKLWPHITNLLIEHGRAICVARKPRCEICPLNKLCPSSRV